MSHETRKANRRRKKTYLFCKKVFIGRGIDIGSGRDTLGRKGFRKIESVEQFDREHGDAQYVHEHCQRKEYDFVYSSNCLEHLDDPYIALKNWFSIVRPGGYLVFAVPDEDLYEQGEFPSKFNPQHKWTFTIHKEKSWSPKSVNVLDIVGILSDARIIKIELVDTNYDYTIAGEDQTLGKTEAFIEVVLQKISDENHPI